MEITFRNMQFDDLLNYSIMEKRYFADTSMLSSHAISFLYESRFSYICEIDGRIVGVSIVENIQNTNLITCLCVESSFRRLNIAKTLIKKTLSAIKEVYGEGTEVEIMCSEMNTNALNLYQSFGFKISKVEKNAYFDETDGLIMKLRIE